MGLNRIIFAKWHEEEDTDIEIDDKYENDKNDNETLSQLDLRVMDVSQRRASWIASPGVNLLCTKDFEESLLPPSSASADSQLAESRPKTAPSRGEHRDDANNNPLDAKRKKDVKRRKKSISGAAMRTKNTKLVYQLLPLFIVL